MFKLYLVFKWFKISAPLDEVVIEKNSEVILSIRDLKRKQPILANGNPVPDEIDRYENSHDSVIVVSSTQL